MENSVPVIEVNETFEPNKGPIVEGRNSRNSFFNTEDSLGSHSRRASYLPVHNRNVRLTTTKPPLRANITSRIPVFKHRFECKKRVQELPIPEPIAGEERPKAVRFDKVAAKVKIPDYHSPNLMLTNKGLFSQGIIN
jgi:hypothetical protein